MTEKKNNDIQPDRFSNDYFRIMARKYADWLYSGIPEDKNIMECHRFPENFLRDIIEECAEMQDSKEAD